MGVMRKCFLGCFFFKQKTAYEIKECDWIQTCALPIWNGRATRTSPMTSSTWHTCSAGKSWSQMAPDLRSYLRWAEHVFRLNPALEHPDKPALAPSFTARSTRHEVSTGPLRRPTSCSFQADRVRTRHAHGATQPTHQVARAVMVAPCGTCLPVSAKRAGHDLRKLLCGQSWPLFASADQTCSVGALRLDARLLTHLRGYAGIRRDDGQSDRRHRLHVYVRA